MEFVFASSNAGKIREIEDLIGNRFQIKSQQNWGIAPPEETASTFLENALIKARNASSLTGLPAIADDSGLCVEALNGLPGVNSANYAGSEEIDARNMSKLLENMKGIENRRAFFICTLIAIRAPSDPAPIAVEGRWYGEIAREPKGNQGFGYDPIFFLGELGCTAAELEIKKKNNISHRAKALKDLIREIDGTYTS